MNWEIIGATGEWVGAIVFLGSILYLAKQIKVASLQFESDVAATMSERMFQAYDPIYEGRNGEIMQIGLDRPEELNDADGFIFNLLMHRQVAAVAGASAQITKGLVSKEQIAGIRIHYQHVIFSRPGAVKWVRDNPMHVGDSLEVIGIELPELSA